MRNFLFDAVYWVQVRPYHGIREVHAARCYNLGGQLRRNDTPLLGIKLKAENFYYTAVPPIVQKDSQ